MAEPQTNSTPTPQSNAPFVVRKMPLDPNYQFTPAPGPRKSPIPGRFEGPVPVNVNPFGR